VTDSPLPLIPIPLRHLPTVAGLVVPWITPRTPDGRDLFGLIGAEAQAACLYGRRCQVCGRPLARPLVLLVRASDLTRKLTPEPGLHPWCAAYTAQACPMVSGRMSRYRATPHDLGGLAAHTPDTPARLGAPAEAWSSVWLAGYRVVRDPATGSLAASYAHTRPLRIRPVAAPAGPDTAGRGTDRNGAATGDPPTTQPPGPKPT
jgi:hypothetical protein